MESFHDAQTISMYVCGGSSRQISKPHLGHNRILKISLTPCLSLTAPLCSCDLVCSTPPDPDPSKRGVYASMLVPCMSISSPAPTD